jgi:hypothetical protein
MFYVETFLASKCNPSNSLFSHIIFVENRAISKRHVCRCRSRTGSFHWEDLQFIWLNYYLKQALKGESNLRERKKIVPKCEHFGRLAPNFRAKCQKDTKVQAKQRHELADTRKWQEKSMHFYIHVFIMDCTAIRRLEKSDFFKKLKFGMILIAQRCFEHKNE